MSLTTREVADWKNQEITKKVLVEIQDEIDQSLAYIASGSHIGETVDKTAMETCRIAGLVSGLSFIFNMEGDDEDE